jgi:hypothetical protein
MICLLMRPPISALPLRVILSAKPLPSGIARGALGWPAYWSLLYLKNSNTST